MADKKTPSLDIDALNDDEIEVIRETVETGAKKRPTYAADNALAVNALDLQALVEHARKTGAEELAARFPNL